MNLLRIKPIATTTTKNVAPTVSATTMKSSVVGMVQNRNANVIVTRCALEGMPCAVY